MAGSALRAGAHVLYLVPHPLHLRAAPVQRPCCHGPALRSPGVLRPVPVAGGLRPLQVCAEQTKYVIGLGFSRKATRHTGQGHISDMTP